MVGIKFPSQQTANERHQPSMATPSRDERAVLGQIAEKAREERTKLDALKAEQTPTGWLDIANPVKSVSLIVGHYDNIQGVHEDEIAKLQTLATGVEVIGALLERGRTLEEIRAIPPRALAAEIGEGGARAVRHALRNPDVRALMERGASAEYSWERGETYASAEHLRDPIDILGLGVQDGVVAVRAELAESGVAGEIGRGYLDSLEATRRAIEEYGGKTAKALIESPDWMSKVSGVAVALAVDVTSTPLRVISPNVTASEQGSAVIDSLMLALGPAQAGKKHTVRSVMRGAKDLATRAVRGAGRRLAAVDVKKLLVVNPRASARARVVAQVVTPRSPTLPNARVTPRSVTIPNAAPRAAAVRGPRAKAPVARPVAPKVAGVEAVAPKVAGAKPVAKASAETVKRAPRTMTREIGSVTIDDAVRAARPTGPNPFEAALREPGPWALPEVEGESVRWLERMRGPRRV